MLIGVNDANARRLAALRRTRAWSQRGAHALFLIAGLGFGSVAYVARTRLPYLWHSGRMLPLLVLVAASVGLFALAGWLHGRASKRAEEIEELEQIDERKRGG